MDEFDNFENLEELLTEPVSTATTPPNLNLDVSTWEGWINSIVLYAAQNPWDFIYYVLIGLSPFFLISVVLSMKLAKALEAQEKETKRKAKRDANLAKARRTKAD